MKKYISTYYFYDVFVSNQDYKSLYDNVVSNIKIYFENIWIKKNFVYKEEEINDYLIKDFSHIGVDIWSYRSNENFQLRAVLSIQKDFNKLKMFIPIIRVELYLSKSFEEMASEVVEEFLEAFEGNYETKWIWESRYLSDLSTDLVHLKELKRLFDKNQNLFHKILNGKQKYKKYWFDSSIRKFNQMLIYFTYLIYVNYKTLELYKSNVKDIINLKQNKDILDEHMEFLDMTDKRVMLNYDTAQKVFEDYKNKLIGFLEIISSDNWLNWQ